MLPIYETLYREMMQDIERCQGLELPEREKAESGYWIASHYWDRLKELLKNKVFEGDEEEIEFFKTVKPAFTSWMDYFILLTEALLFVPADRKGEIPFWESESLRFQRFCQKHADFVCYLERGEIEQDEAYFLRRHAGKNSGPQALLETEPGFSTARDGLTRNYLAQKRFYEFTMGRAMQLKAL